MIRSATFALLLVATTHTATGQTGQVESVETRPGIKVQVLFIGQPDAVANVVLLAGGHGAVTFYPNGEPNALAANFLIRTRNHFTNHRLNVAIPGAPSDRPAGVLDSRNSPEYAEDLQAILAAVRKRANLPTWLIGTSAGTVGVAAASANLSKERGPDGIVLNSSNISPSHPRSVLAEKGLGDIRVPVLIQHHEKDECTFTPFSQVPTLVGKLLGSPVKKVITYTAGGPPKGDGCGPYGWHGYVGIEGKVVDDIATFIAEQESSRK